MSQYDREQKAKDIVARHTPVPWTKGETVISKGIETAKANAAFIVRAVNNHEALLEAVKSALNVLEGFPGFFVATEIKKLEDAIKKAEGK